MHRQLRRMRRLCHNQWAVARNRSQCDLQVTLHHNFRLLDQRPCPAIVTNAPTTTYTRFVRGKGHPLGAQIAKESPVSHGRAFSCLHKKKPRTGGAGAFNIRSGNRLGATREHRPRRAIRPARCHFPDRAATFLFPNAPLKPKWVTPRFSLHAKPRPTLLT